MAQQAETMKMPMKSRVNVVLPDETRRTKRNADATAEKDGTSQRLQDRVRLSGGLVSWRCERRPLR
jgi:hypothetical protein